MDDAVHLSVFAVVRNKPADYHRVGAGDGHSMVVHLDDPHLTGEGPKNWMYLMPADLVGLPRTALEPGKANKVKAPEGAQTTLALMLGE